jgi:hypothetical protein
MKKKTLFVAAAATSSFTAFLIFYSIAATALSDQSGTITNIQNGPDSRQEEKGSGTWNLIAFRYSEDRLKSFGVQAGICVPKMCYYYDELMLG